jgi:hypothetical protein
MFRVYFTNHGYYADRRFSTFEEAVAYGKNVHFEFQVRHQGIMRDDNYLIATWSPIGGLRHYTH